MNATPLTGLAAIPVGELHPSPNNPREHLDGIPELAQSIRENGLIQPLVVQKVPGLDGWQIIAGHRRYAACKHLGMAKAPCIIRRDMLPDEELLAMLVENGQRANLDPIEEAKALNRLSLAGKSNEEIARQVGRSPYWVNARLLLLQLPPEEQEAVRAGHYTLTDAAQIIRNSLAAERKTAGTGQVGRPKGRKTTPYFGDTHPLAKTVRAICDHRGRPKVGSVGCGGCWEHAIRADAQNTEAVAS